MFRIINEGKRIILISRKFLDETSLSECQESSGSARKRICVNLQSLFRVKACLCLYCHFKHK